MNDSNKENINKQDFYKVVTDCSVRKTYVVFSSVDIRPGEFMFWRVMNGIPGTKIFVNEIDNGWYVHGIPTLGNSVKESANGLLRLIKDSQPEEVIFIGPSMGAYGAMLYGCILKNQLVGVKVKCISFGGEFVLYGRETRSGLLTKKDKNYVYADLRALLDISGLELIHIYGDADINDIYQASLVSNIETIKAISIKNAPHAVSTFIGKNYNLIDLITEIVDGVEISTVPISDVSKHPSFGYDIFNGHLSLLDGEKNEALNMLRKAVLEYPTHAVARHKYGIALLQLDKVEEAMTQQNEAISLDPNLAHAYYHLGLIYDKKCILDDALKQFYKCLSIAGKHVQAKYALAIVHHKKGEKDLAIMQLRSLLEIDPTHSRADDFLKSIIN